MKPQILFIDDEIEMIGAFRDFLQRDYLFYTVQTVQDGLKLLREKEFNVVICDMRMPGLDGADFLEIANSAFRKPIKIILSAYVDEFFDDHFQTTYKPYAIVRKPLTNPHPLVKVLKEAVKEYEFRYGELKETKTEIVNTQEVLKRLGISKPTLYKYLRAGLPSERIGGRRFFKWNEVSLWIKNPLEKF